MRTRIIGGISFISFLVWTIISTWQFGEGVKDMTWKNALDIAVSFSIVAITFGIFYSLWKRRINNLHATYWSMKKNWHRLLLDLGQKGVWSNFNPAHQTPEVTKIDKEMEILGKGIGIEESVASLFNEKDL